MLNKNIKNLRLKKGLSQEELATKIYVVRQTISKWENGLSVPDSEMIISLANVLDTTVSELLGETIEENTANNLNTISEKLEAINLQFLKKQIEKTKRIRVVLTTICVINVAIFIVLYFIKSPYLNWDYSKPEYAVVGTLLHGFEFFFIRIAPIILLLTVLGIVLTYRKK